MAITALIVCQRPNRQRWLLTQDGAPGTTITFTTTGIGSPDVRAQAPAGAIRDIAKTFLNGYGSFGPGALTGTEAEALWLSKRVPVDPGTTKMTARCEFTPRTGTTHPAWIVDANVDGAGHPVLDVIGPLAAATAYLDIELEGGAIGA